jgi:hypothetical protein
MTFFLTVLQTCLGLDYGGLVMILDLSYFWKPQPFVGQCHYVGLKWFFEKKTVATPLQVIYSVMY